jgi:hypothetical protein
MNDSGFMPIANQPRGADGEKARPYAISLYPATIDQLERISEATKESLGSIVRRLTEAEYERLQLEGVPTYEVLTFPSYDPSGPRVRVTVMYHRPNGPPEAILAQGDRLLPGMPDGSLVLIRRGPKLGNLYGKLVDHEIVKPADGEETLVLTVDALPTPNTTDDARGLRYLGWREAIFEGVGRRLSRRVPLTGSDRVIGAYRISNSGPLTNAGEIAWSVLMRRGSVRKSRRLAPVRWDQTDPAEVIDAILAAIHELEARP